MTTTSISTLIATDTHEAPQMLPQVADAYADLTDRRLAATLTAEDEAEEQGLNPFERVTCRTHRRWLHTCVSSPLHVVAVSGHRWCRDCKREVSVSIDELTGDVVLTCSRCHRTPDTFATRQLVRACRGSLAAAAEARSGETAAFA